MRSVVGGWTAKTKGIKQILLSAPAKSLIDRLGIETTLNRMNDRLWVAIVQGKTDQPTVAYERFTDTGPLAVLPLGGGRISIVWQVAGPVDLARLNHAIGHRVQITAIECESEVPAMAISAQSLARPGIALVGSASQVLHPVAGQGLNLILRQLHGLFSHGFEHWAAWQTEAIADRQRWMNTTLTLAHLFQWDWPGAGCALSAVAVVPGASNTFVRRFMEGR